ncbi:hypothetical protein BDR03DRAFT_1088631 [Suillus americanus]|nr:hypothetical protein BDR03DRAFT_1088631 [Suillus americanus]
MQDVTGGMRLCSESQIAGRQLGQNLHNSPKSNDRFAGLFAGRSRAGQKRTFNEGPSDENDQNVPPATRPRLEITPSNSAITSSHVAPSYEVPVASSSRNILPSIPPTSGPIFATSSLHNTFPPHSHSSAYHTSDSSGTYNPPFNPYLHSNIPSGSQTGDYFSAYSTAARSLPL